jgi:hypothetical protein
MCMTILVDCAAEATLGVGSNRSSSRKRVSIKIRGKYHVLEPMPYANSCIHRVASESPHQHFSSLHSSAYFSTFQSHPLWTQSTCRTYILLAKYFQHRAFLHVFVEPDNSSHLLVLSLSVPYSMWIFLLVSTVYMQYRICPLQASDRWTLTRVCSRGFRS